MASAPLTLSLFDPDGDHRVVEINAKPIGCPWCKSFESPELLGAIVTGRRWDARRDAIAVCQCGNYGCRSVSTAFYTLVIQNGVETGRLLQNRPLEHVDPGAFSDAIRALSSVFCETYSQALRAEENGLAEICGAGFRRALEFLCKDFALSRRPNDDQQGRERIVRSTLGQCIESYLPDAIKLAAKRAAWLGNDETHYYRVWTERDLHDLKALIQLTAKSIDFTLELEHYVTIMPDGKR